MADNKHWFNRRLRKEFNKQPEEVKADILLAIVNKQIESATTKAIANSIISGTRQAYRTMYENFVSRIDDSNLSDTEREKAAVELLSHIRKEYLKVRAAEMKEAKSKEAEE